MTEHINDLTQEAASGNSAPTIPSLIKDGKAFLYDVNVPSLAAGASYSVSILAPARSGITALGLNTNSDLGTLQVLRNSSFTGGSPKTLPNMNDNFPDLSGVVTDGVTISAAGAVKMNRVFIGTSGQGQVVYALSGKVPEGIMFTEGATYEVSVTNNSASAHNFTFSFILFTL